MEKNSIINNLINNALTRHDLLKESSKSALKTICHQSPKKIIEYIDLSFQNSQEITSEILNLFCMLFLESQKQLNIDDNQNQAKNELNLKVFVSLQFYYTKCADSFQQWDDLCSIFITTSNIAKQLYPFVLNPTNIASGYSYITLYYCSNFVYEEIISGLDLLIIKRNSTFYEKLPNLIKKDTCNYIRLITNLCQKCQTIRQSNDDLNSSYVSLFLSTQFRYIMQYFLDNSFNMDCFNCINQLFDAIYPLACPIYLRIYVSRICNEINLANDNSNEQVILIENLLIKFCSTQDSEILKNTVDFILQNMSAAYYIEYQKHAQNHSRSISIFPIDATEMDPSFTSSPVFVSSVENISKLCFSDEYKDKCSDIVISSLLEGIDKQLSPIVFKTISSLLNSSKDLSSPKRELDLVIKFNEEELLMIISSITAATTKKIPDPSLCRLSLDLLKLPSKYISETEVNSLTNYLINASLLMHNSHYLLQIVSSDKNQHQMIFNMLAESLFDDSKISLIPSILQTINLFVALSHKDDTSTIEDQHPLVSFLFKKSIFDKSLFLLRMLSCLISLGAIHPFVPSMINILSIFFDFAFPLAFSEIKLILEAVTKRINSLHPETQLQLKFTNLETSKKSSNNDNNANEFASIVMSLLSNIMKLINDSQFRISLCSAVIHDVEMNQYQRHNQNCLWIFDTIIPFLPFEVASANIDKLFKIISFNPVQLNPNQASSIKADNPSLRNLPSFHALVNDSNNQETAAMTLNVFADVLGSISGRHYKLIYPIIKSWKSMKSNASFLVGQKQQPIPYMFIAIALACISREVEVPILLEIANSDLFPLLISLMKRKSNELHFNYCLNALIELCARLTFHKVPSTFNLLPDKSSSNNEFIFKYIINIFLNNKQKSMFVPCLAALRYFIQVPPCLTVAQRATIREKVITPTFILSAIDDPDKQLFLEVRGLILGMICALPEIATLVSIICVLMPICEKSDVVSLIWRSFSIYEANRMKNWDVSDTSAQIKFNKPVEVGKISLLPKIIADLLCTYYIYYKDDEDTSVRALQSIYLLFRIDRNIETDNNSVQTISDLAKSVFNELTQNELEFLLSYLIDGLKKHKASSVNYSFVISQLMKYILPKEKLTILNSQIEQICANSINNAHADQFQYSFSSMMQSSNLYSTLSHLYDNNFLEFPCPFFVQQLIIHYPEIFVKKLVNFGFNEFACQYLSKAFGEESGICVEMLIQQLCLLLLEISEDDHYSSNILLFIAFIIVSSTKENSFVIPMVHIYQIICSLLIFGVSTNEFNNANSLYKDDLYKKIEKIAEFQSICSSPSINPNMKEQINQKQLLITVLGIAVHALQTSKSTDLRKNDIELQESKDVESHSENEINSNMDKTDQSMNETNNEEIVSISPNADEAFPQILSMLTKRKENCLLIDMLDFFMSSCPLNFHRVSSSIAIYCGEVLNNFVDLFESREKHSEILHLYFKTLLSLASSFDEFTYIVSICEITKFLKRNDLHISHDENDSNVIFPVAYLHRILQVILKRLTSFSLPKSLIQMTNAFVISTLLCLKQFSIFSLYFNPEMTNLIFNIIVELLKGYGKKYVNLISDIIYDIVNSQSENEFHSDYIKLILVYQIITCRPLNQDKDAFIHDADMEAKQISQAFDVQKEKESVCFVFDLFLNSNVSSLISSALSLLTNQTYNWIIPQYAELIAKFLQNQDETVAEAATRIIESFLCSFKDVDIF